MSREFSDLVKAVGDCKSKQEEDRIIQREVALLRVRLSERDSAARMKELCVRMMYCEMLGQPVEFGYIHAVNLTQRTNLMEKRTGYLAASLFLDSKSELLILLVNTLQKDLKSQNPWEVCAALSAMTRLIGSETVPAVLKQVVDLLSHTNDQVRKKATMVLHRFLQTCPSAVQDHLDLFKRALCDRDPSVMSASLCAIHDLARQEPAMYQNLVPSLVIILKQVRQLAALGDTLAPTVPQMSISHWSERETACLRQTEHRQGVCSAQGADQHRATRPTSPGPQNKPHG